MTKHTPKPWKAVGGVIYDAKMRAVARAGCLADLDETDANVRLIAAAPEMFQALHDLVTGENQVLNSFLIDKAIQALNNADNQWTIRRMMNTPDF